MTLNSLHRLSVAIMAVALACCVGCSTRSDASAPTPPADSLNPNSVRPSRSKKAPQPDSLRNLTFAFVGDIMMGTTYPESPKGAYLPPRDGADLFRDCDSLLRSADVAAGNLEGTLFDNGGTVKRCSNPALCYAFRTPTRYVVNLTGAGFDLLSMANNHSNDFGPEGVTSTMRTLRNAGIAYAGLAGKCDTASIIRDGRSIGFAAFGANRGNLSINDLALVRRVVGSLKRNHDLVVVSFHGGAEGPAHTRVPHATETAFGENRGNVERFAHAAVDAGADVVYGHGPHVVRAAELYKGHLILYSLGNFCTPYRVSLGGLSGQAPVVTAELAPDGTFVKGRIHSFIQQKGIGPRSDATNAVARQMGRLSKADFPSSPLVISSDGTLSRW